MYFINLLFMVVFVYVFAAKSIAASATRPAVYLTGTFLKLRAS